MRFPSRIFAGHIEGSLVMNESLAFEKSVHTALWRAESWEVRR